MKNKLALLFGCWICFSTCFSAFTPEEAHRIFDESSPYVSSSATTVGDYLFLKIKWEEDKSLSTEDQEAQEMMALLEAMRKFITPQSCVCTNSPFCKTLTDWLLPETEFNVPNVQSSTIKDESINGERIQIIAVEAAPLIAAKDMAIKKVLTINSRTEAEWVNALKGVKSQFTKPEDTQKFYTILGCPIVNLIFTRSNNYQVSVLPGCECACDELKTITKFVTESNSFFVKHPNILWDYYTHNHSGLFFPSWEENDNGQFTQAEKLYRQGKDISKIITFLVESLSINPISSTKWEYLGGVLKASGKPKDAIIAYIQSLKINSKNQWSWKGLMDCCEKAGLKENAKGLKWYLKIKE